KDVALHDCYRVDRMALHHLYTAYQVFSGMSVVFPKRKLKQLWIKLKPSKTDHVTGIWRKRRINA
ncbi:MAG: hypothetical protein AB4058_02540, partial [Microcystaceae cyanobacterium]